MLQSVLASQKLLTTCASSNSSDQDYLVDRKNKTTLALADYYGKLEIVKKISGQVFL